jgi:cysteine desulfurase/selenocysteine lyase
MIGTVTTDYFTTADLPYKFEAGTPNIAGAIGWGAALDYLGEIGLDIVAGQEKELVNFVIPVLENIPGVKIIGNPKKRGGIISFVYEGAHPHDLAQLMDRYGIAMRSGHHCAQPALSKMGLDATARISFYVYNTYEDAEFFLDALNKVIKFF